MEFHLLSFIIGFAICGVLAVALVVEIRRSIASAMIYGLCSEVQWAIALAYARLEIENPEDDDIDVERVYPIKNAKFTIVNLPELRKQSYVLIEDFVGVHVRERDLFLIIKTLTHCETFNQHKFCYLSDASFDFSSSKLVKKPLEINIEECLE